jgi:hypothetical protein
MTYFIFSFGYVLHPMIMEVLGEVLGLIFIGKDEESVCIQIIHLIMIASGFGGYAWLTHSVFPTDPLFD